MVSELNALLARLREALDKQKRFTADAAHELRSPLTALQIQLDMLSRARSADETRDAVEGLRAGVKRAGRLVEQLLTMARLEPQSQTSPVPVALDQLLTEVATELEPLAEARRVQLRLSRLERATIRGEPQGLHALVRNLIDNAIRYTPAGGEVRLALFRDGGAAAIVVEDTGPGIPAADRGRVFDRFFRLPGAGAEGSGLGLAIVKQVADAHGATVELGEGEGGKGLRVAVRFTSLRPPPVGAYPHPS
jgi:two-component system OmpR family sensor kinase